MDDEKRLCPNCGKELTKSARKCKYCDESLIPKSESSIKNFKEFLFVAFCITLVLLVFWSIISLIFNLGHWLFSHFQQRIPQEIVQLPNINDWFFGDFLPWLVNTGIGPGIGIIVLGGIIIAVFILSIKESIPGTKEILDELASIDFTTEKNRNNNANFNKHNNEIEDFRKRKYGKYGGAASNSNVYAIIRYKSENPNFTFQLFYEFKLWAYHIADAPQMIWVKGKDNHNTCTAKYNSYQIISSQEYMSSNLPSELNYDYYKE